MTDHKLTIEVTWYDENQPPIFQASGNPPDDFKYARLDKVQQLLADGPDPADLPKIRELVKENNCGCKGSSWCIARTSMAQELLELLGEAP